MVVKEVPMRIVKFNQAGIVLFVLLSLLLQQTWILAVLWLIQVAGLMTQGKLNVFTSFAKWVLKDKGKETQAVELQRFNNVLAVLFLTLALICFTIGWSIAGIVFTAMLLAAAGAALLGYCIGCTVYYRYKLLRSKFS